MVTLEGRSPLGPSRPCAGERERVDRLHQVKNPAHTSNHSSDNGITEECLG